MSQSSQLGEPSAPKLKLTTAPSSGTAPLSVKFTATCSGSVCVAYVWDFGDGTTAAGGSTQTHIYTVAGTYYPIVAVTNAKGQGATATTTITALPPCGPPNYCSSTSTTAVLTSPPPQLGLNSAYLGGYEGAGLTASVSDYGNNRVHRVTDGLSESTFAGASFAVGSSAEKNISSYDETIFVVHGYNGRLCFYSWNASAFASTQIMCTTAAGSDGDFGYASADNGYYFGWYQAKLYRFQIGLAGTVTADPTFNNGLGYFDPDNAECLNGKIAANKWYTGDSALSSDDSTDIVAVGPEQDEDPYFVVWNATKGCFWMNVKTWEVSNGWNAGQSNSIPIAFKSGVTPPGTGGVHNAQLDRSGETGILTINGTTLPYKVFWTMGTNAVDDTCVTCQSHWASDFGMSFWEVKQLFQQLTFGVDTFTPDSMALPDDYDTHVSHANASPTIMYPYLVSLDPGAASYFSVAAPYQDELVGVTFNGGSTALYRFNKTFTGSNSFNSSARCSISRQGNYALCASDYQMYNEGLGFGNGYNQNTCDPSLATGLINTDGCRTDVLLFELW
jgi:PKD repeat protein